MGRILYLAGALVALSLSGPVWAEFYQWTDARGVVHFADEKPKDGGSEGLTITRELPETPVVRVRSSGNFRYKDTSGSAVRGRRGTDSHGKAADPQACAEVKASLEKVQAQLRSGYREPQGNRLREKRRALRTRYAHLCR